MTAPDRPGDRDQQQAADEMICPDCDIERADYEGPDGAWLPHCPNCGSEAAPEPFVSVIAAARAEGREEGRGDMERIEREARAEEAAWWRAKIEALATTFTERRDHAWSSGSEYRRGLADGFDAANEYLRAVLDAS